MKTIVVLAALLAVAVALPQRREVNPNAVAVVKEALSNNIGVGGYEWSYELSDGQTRQESAQIETRANEEPVLRVQGSFSWVNPENGQTYTVIYIADENGFQPQGSHIPK